MNNNSIPAKTIFITGISASGKSTLGKRLKDDLAASGVENVELLDGEAIRVKLASEGRLYGFSTAERNELSLQKAHICAEYNNKGIICVVCAICHVKEIREQMRTIIGEVMEVYLECPVDACAKRDYKGHYAKAFEGFYDNFIGVTEPYQESEHTELILHTGRDPIEECSQVLLKSAIAFLKKPKAKPVRLEVAE